MMEAELSMLPTCALGIKERRSCAQTNARTINCLDMPSG